MPDSTRKAIDPRDLARPQRLQLDNFTDNMWGGEWIPRLKQLNRRSGGPVGESWEFSAHPLHPSRVETLGGISLRDLLSSAAPAVVGAKDARRLAGRPPFLLKLIDSRDDLSVQVHPPDDYALAHENDSGKAESWIIIDADPSDGGGCIYLGFDPRRAEGFADRAAFAEAFLSAIAQANAQGPSADRSVRARAERLVLPFLNRIDVKPGEAYDIPPGTIHAIGRGVRLFEIQQSSDLTYRVWDWNRPDAKRLKEGKMVFRELHLDRARAVLDFEARPPETYRREPVEAGIEGDGRRWTLVSHDERRYAADRIVIDKKAGSIQLPRGFSVLTVLSGEAAIECGGAGWGRAGPGESVLIPDAAGEIRLKAEKPPLEIIRSYLPA